MLDFLAKGSVTTSDASILTDRVRSLIVQSRRFKVMERENMAHILKEQGFQSTQVCDSQDCYLQLGHLLAVRRIITGSVSRLGKLYIVNLRVVDVEKGLILQEVFSDCNCPRETLMTDTVPQLVQRLIGGPTQQSAPQVTPSASPQPPASEPLFADWAASGARRLRSAQFYIEGGNIRYGSLGFLYNLNDYFGLGLRGGVDTAKPYYDILPYLAGNLRLYTNPHALAGFLDLDLGVHPTQIGSLLTSTGRVGLEYRSFQTGLTLTLSGGVTANLTGPGYPLAVIRPEVNLAIGWAF